MIKNPKLTLVLAVDPYYLPGCCVTVTSALNNCPRNQQVDIYLLHINLSSDEVEVVESAARSLNSEARVLAKVIDPRIFGGLKTMHGNSMAYVRLLIGHILTEPRCIYLDADLLINLDLNDLWIQDLNGCSIGAVQSGLGLSADRPTLEFYLAKSVTDYFNSGVLLIDLDRWRSDQVLEKALEFAKIRGIQLPNWDQTLLNLVLHEKFHFLPSYYNRLIAPWQRPEKCAMGREIWHYISTPKPWMFLGSMFNRSSDTYNSFARTIPRYREALRIGCPWEKQLSVFWSSRRLYSYPLREIYREYKEQFKTG